MRKLNLILKRIVDIFGSLLGGIVLLPVFLSIAVAIKTTSKGPVFFEQDRLGKNGKRFKILKFRTMVVGAEHIGDGIFVKSESDDRITRIGKLLRRTSLDELPQLWNVLRGEMSLVGPRPPVPHRPFPLEQYSEIQRKRFEMKPGITGLAQVKVRNSVPWEERIKIDVEYVEHFDLALDIKILISTIKKIFFNDSVYEKMPQKK